MMASLLHAAASTQRLMDEPMSLLGGESVTTINYVLGHAGIYWTGIGRPLPPNWPALVEAYAERRARQLH